ncbi:hypothetical protein KIN20_013653 [Parelaphostrongylus tenuis]|uniref:Uncharacterized protein n=1 Tax=Parelaphostrongylus tenuis TaxID=148309 RepID=A0AAD5QR67_PARTN|nr:hypothetical protein KIN20_013653 [Parelaphostrongylus tenuis]
MVTDVLEEQGRRAGLFPTVISGISTQLTIRFSYNALQCDNVLVNPNDAQNMQIVVTMGVQGTCIFIGNTVSTICTAMPATRCMHHGNVYRYCACAGNTSDYIWSSLAANQIIPHVTVEEKTEIKKIANCTKGYLTAAEKGVPTQNVEVEINHAVEGLLPLVRTIPSRSSQTTGKPLFYCWTSTTT